MSVEQVFRKVQRALDAAGVPYMVTASIIRVQGENLDAVYVERWARDLDLKEQWLAAKTRAG